MTIPKLAIEKAIEGGWQDGQALDSKRIEITGMGYIRIYHWDSSEFNAYDWQEVALDPTFWQALGKALGWPKEVNYPAKEIYQFRCAATCDFHAHRFYDLVLTGGGTEAFWKELLETAEA